MSKNTDKVTTLRMAKVNMKLANGILEFIDLFRGEFRLSNLLNLLAMVHKYLLGTTKSSNVIKKNFDLRPGCITRDLNLKRPIFKKTAAYGHFGRKPYTENGMKFFEWENPADLTRFSLADFSQRGVESCRVIT